MPLPSTQATVLRAVRDDQAANQGLVDKVYMHYYLVIEKMKLSFAALRTEVEVTVSSVEIQVTKDKFHMW